MPQKAFVVERIGEVLVAAQPQMLVHRPLEGAVGRFDIPILIGGVHVNGTRLAKRANVHYQLQVAFVVAALGQGLIACFRTERMGRGGRVVRLTRA